MPRICTICTHPDRIAIDKAVVSQAPNRQIASLHGVSESAVRRHARSHLPKTLVVATQVEAVTNADDLLAQVQRFQREALGVLEAAKADGNLGGVLQAIDRLQKGVALLATLGERGHESKEIVVRWSDDCPHHTNGECPASGGSEAA
jgi:hypothetical protein